MDDPLSGKRVLLAAEYVEHGGTRAYVLDLLSFFSRHGASGVLLSSWSAPDPAMETFATDCGFSLIRYADVASGSSFRSLGTRPTVWSPRAVSEEIRLFRQLAASHALDSVTISVGTSGLFLSALHAATRPIMIAHGYPHGLRQRVLGPQMHARLIPRDTKIVTVSEFSATHFRRAWRTNGRGVSVTPIYSTRGSVPSCTPLSRREGMVLTAALVEAHKEPSDWLRMASHVRDVRPDSSFTWVGEGPLRSAAIKRAQETGLGRDVFPGWADDVEPWYRRARVYVQTSSTEALGLSVLDALRFGLPAVVTDAGGLPEVVVDGLNGFIVPVGNAEAASKAVLKLLKDDALWERQSRAARDLYVKRFSPERWDEALIEVHRAATRAK